jgi:hypothetical protein
VAFASAGCMALAVALLRESETGITGMAPAQRKWPSLGVSLIQFAEQCWVSAAELTEVETGKPSVAQALIFPISMLSARFHLAHGPRWEPSWAARPLHQKSATSMRQVFVRRTSTG